MLILINRSARVTKRVKVARAATTTKTTSRRVTAGNHGIIAAVIVEPVSGFEPLTVRLQGGCSAC